MLAMALVPVAIALPSCRGKYPFTLMRPSLRTFNRL